MKTNVVQEQVETLTAVAKKLSSEGKDAQALEAYQSAAGLMLGAPWLQNRTAELARKLRLNDIAALHYRRAAAAFIKAGFPKRALGPLRTAWQVTVNGLPATASAFITISLELSNVQRELGFSSDAKLTVNNANQALEAAGSEDRVPSLAETELRAVRPPSQPPESGVKDAAGAGSALLSRLESAVKP